MAEFVWEAKTRGGEVRKGVMEADTAKAARGLLRAQALVPLAVAPVNASGRQAAGGTGLRTTLFESRVFNATGLAIWTRQVAGLVSSGLPLERSRFRS